MRSKIEPLMRFSGELSGALMGDVYYSGTKWFLLQNLLLRVLKIFSILVSERASESEGIMVLKSMRRTTNKRSRKIKYIMPECDCIDNNRNVVERNKSTRNIGNFELVMLITCSKS
ncbi:hypothetical protein PUN28_004515 [Cardiocondyla obscurior]|uniref:Uncharacterized protein n=1 Tax=Cardiocondyla obscurior TaxID=286306 RepID=A0AAW2GG87_9HYME